MHALVATPSPWVERWAPLIRAGGSVLDVACGRGRHVHWLSEQGFALTALDRDADALNGLQGLAETVVADIEADPWPLAGRRFDAVVVTNYLWRPLWPHLLGALADGGVLIYETFALGNETVGRPARAEFLLRRGELLQCVRGLDVVAFEDGFVDAPARFIQRIAAVRPAEGTTPPPRHRLCPGQGPGA